jgi:hypothetical protein
MGTNRFYRGCGTATLAALALAIIVGTHSGLPQEAEAAYTPTAMHAVRAKATGTQTLASGTYTVLNFADEDGPDVGSMHDTVTNNSRITAPATGWYVITGGVQFATNATSVRGAAIRLDGTTYINSNHGFNTGGTATAGVTVGGIYYLTAGQYVELLGVQMSGGNLDTVLTDQGVWFAAARVN